MLLVIYFRLLNTINEQLVLYFSRFYDLLYYCSSHKNKTMKKLLLLTCALALLMSSCVSYKHSYRMSDVGDTRVSVDGPYVADLDIDFTKVIKATSRKHVTAGMAKEEAYYNAILQNNVHVVVDPIYSVRTVRTLFGAKSTAEVTGFSGMYKNARKKSDDAANALARETDLFNARFASIKKLSDLKALTEEEVNVYSVKNGGCCGDGENTSLAGPTLLTTTKNKTGLIDSYNKIIGVGNGSSSDSSVALSSPSSAVDTDDNAEPKGFFGKVRSFFGNVLDALTFWN